MNSRKGFTLIELLVVIAIIALLLAVIMPSLKKVKRQAAAIVCLANMRGMAAAWHAYTADNNGKMVNGHVPRRVGPVAHHWVEAPQDNAGVYTGEKPLANTVLPVQEEQNGIRKGLLFPYLGAVDAYHCPAEKAAQLFAHASTAPFGSWWNCYSITGLMNGEACKENYDIYNWSGTPDQNGALKLSEVKIPGNRVVFLENGDQRGWLMGSWLMNYTTPAWVDPFAIWHGDQSPLGFADGHGENHVWKDRVTIENAKFPPAINKYPLNETPPQTEDITYMDRHYVPSGH